MADIVIIGGGIVGTSVAWHLSLMGAGKIVLLERENFLGAGSTGRCAGGFRHQFSTEINIRLSLASVPLILSFSEDLGHPIDVHQDGYLFLLSNERDLAAFRRNIELQRRLGVRSEFLDHEETARLAPHMNPDGVLGGAYCADDGIGDPDGMTQGYAAGARRRGVAIRTAVEAVGIRTRNGKIEGVDTSQGFLPCRTVVNAAGPYARRVAAWAGVDLPVYPERRHVYTTHPFAEAPEDFLMMIDFATTFYCHRESGGVLMGMGNPAEPSGFNLSVDPGFLEKLLDVALGRFPALGNAAINRAWAGLYEMSPDAHAILGRVEDVEGFYLANGFSGHGFQHAPIVGRLVAEEIVNGSARTIDISPLRLDRFKKPIGLKELNVV